MKSRILTVFFAAVAMALSAQMPRSEWHAKVGECALDPVSLKATIGKLSSADKKAFLAEVNEAISKMPGSPEAKAAQFMSINRAAVAGAGSADRLAVLAEVFATVQTEALTVVNEEFSKNEFARPDTMNGEQYVKIVSAAMAKIVERCASSESGAVRSGFAGVMFIRAAGDAADAAQAAVVSAMPPESRIDARNSWFPAALGKDQPQSYDPMLAAAQAGEEPDHSLVNAINGSQIIDSMLADLQAGGLPEETASGSRLGSIPVNFLNGDTDAMNVRFPELPRGRVNERYIPKSMITGNVSDKNTLTENPYYSDGRGEPGPYWLQNL